MARKKTAGRLKAFLLLFSPAFLLVVFGLLRCEHKFKELDDLGVAKTYTFTDVNGKKRTSSEFKGRVVLVTTLQPTCPDSCAVSFWHLDKKIYQHIRKNKKKLGSVRIISFITDGLGNPSSNLKDVEDMLKDRVEEYDPEIWILASGDAKKLYDFERNGEKLLKQGDEFFGGEAYQELMLLLDRDNHLRMVMSGNTEGTIRRMNEHIALLQKQYDKAKK